MQPIIRVHNLSKRYRIGRVERYHTLRESIVRSVTVPVRLARKMFGGREGAAQEGERQMWALNDVSFDVMPGEVLGLIGRNGAGKSTLLKVLSRITEPSAGRAEIYGRVGSLLEVGTGFHLELTGRENIYLSGAILGMRRAEIQRKFDEIVAFAEVEKFVDTPVKHYSSGMHVRLGFSVAAHLEPEILLVDEVLAVGDAAFQKKCLGKMGDVARAGRTIIFVSHNMASIESLCNSCLLISSGRLEARGQPAQIVMRYMASELRGHGGFRSLVDHSGRRGDSIPIATSIRLRSAGDGQVGVVRMGAPLAVAVDFNAPHPIRPTLGITLKTADGMPLFGVSNRWTNQGADNARAASGTITCTFERLPLMPGTYLLDLFFGDFGDVTRDLDVVREAISFEVVPADLLGTGMLPNAAAGPVFWTAKWTSEIAP
ncbi:MAG TPA: ABC transporter ATP-binding protein [Candidatus Binataceae bacterium]|jgi:lipopolysaccharide transport system ATP-binding protein|nr:ABC transporter ATP-binding protein [Candidatus Binataceae bacterium]